MYPRSFNSVGMLQAYADIAIDVPKRKITIHEGVEGDFPLPAFADWKNGIAPFVSVEKGKVSIFNKMDR